MTVQAGTAHGREHLGFPDGVIAPGKLLCHSAGRERIAVRVMKIRGRHDERQLDLLSVYGSIYHVEIQRADGGSTWQDDSQGRRSC